MKEPRITAWDQRKCQRCRRVRVHYREQGEKWNCIGTLPGAGVVPCGKRRINFPELHRSKASTERSSE